jgi:hypothetical protein
MRYFIVLLSLFCGVSHAQEKAEKHTCRILFLERPPGAPTELHMFDGRASQKVELPGMNLSPVYELPAGPLTLTFLPAPPLDPEQLPTGAPSVRVPETMTDFYLLVLSDPANKVAPVRVHAINAATGTLRKGHTLWFNLTDLLIGGKLGDESLMIKPKGTAVMGPPRSDGGDYPVTMAYRNAGVDVQHPICETRWVHDPRTRNLGFIISQEASQAPRVMLFPDFRSEPEKRGEDTNEP